MSKGVVLPPAHHAAVMNLKTFNNKSIFLADNMCITCWLQIYFVSSSWDWGGQSSFCLQHHCCFWQEEKEYGGTNADSLTFYPEVTHPTFVHIYWPKQVKWANLTPMGREIKCFPSSKGGAVNIWKSNMVSYTCTEESGDMAGEHTKMM